MTEAPAPIRLQYFIVGFTRFALSLREWRLLTHRGVIDLHMRQKLTSLQSNVAASLFESATVPVVWNCSS